MVFLLVSLFDMGMCKSSQVLNFSIIIIAVVWGCTVHLSMNIILRQALTVSLYMHMNVVQTFSDSTTCKVTPPLKVVTIFSYLHAGARR